MGFYQLKRTMEVNAPVEKVWKFISSPKNLKLITPDYMGFDITSEDPSDRMYKGMIISYRVAPLMGIKTTWVTEITQVEENRYFVDEQRVGPYAMWHHQHFIEPSGNGTLMTDIVSYKPPMGILGSIANRLIIRKKLDQIFRFRKSAILSLFGEKKMSDMHVVMHNS
jgi:ligand-binding SRPBCC domain-containing protein